MKRLGLILGFVLATAALVIPVATQAQKPAPRIAYVYIFKEGPSAPFSQEFRQRLRELGWTAKALSFPIPQSLLVRADEVIQ